MKKGKNRRYREARELKQTDRRDPDIENLLATTLNEPDDVTSAIEECAECMRSPHADWCMAEEE